MNKIERLMKLRSDKGVNDSPKETFRQYNILKKKGLFDFKTWKYKLINKYHPLSTIKVNMQLTNGEVMPFVVKVKDGGFVFDNGFYLVDENYKYYDNNSGLWTFDYHEELCFPIDKRVNIKDLKDEIYGSKDVELETAVNPVSLNKFMESTVIQKLLAGAEMEDSLRKMKVMVMISLVIGGVSMLLLLNMSGILG